MGHLFELTVEIIYHIPFIIWKNIKALFQTKYQRHENVSIDNYKFMSAEYNDVLDLYRESVHVKLNEEKMNSDHSNWLDVDKLIRGQKFATSNYFSISYTNLISLYLIFAHDKSLRTLIYTRQSGDIESAYKRYISTIHRVKSWYEEDLTNPKSSARQHIRVVNSYHLNLSSKLNPMDEDRFITETNLENKKIENIDNIHERMRYCSTDEDEKSDRLLQDLERGLHVNQLHMAMTQFGFMGLTVLYPEKFGIDNLEDLECFVYLWMYIGSMLGIEDKYNLCCGNIDEVKKKCLVILNFIFKPSLLQANYSWEHMSLCVFHGINRLVKLLIFESTVVHLMECVDIKCGSLYNSMKFKSKCCYYFFKIVFEQLVPIQGIRKKLNNTIDIVLEEVKVFSNTI